jgi:hypothetical protein
VPRPPSALTSEQLQRLVDQTNPLSGMFGKGRAMRAMH